MTTAGETVTRTDRASLASAGLRPPEVTPEGFLRVDAYLYRGGVQEYRRADGTIVREYRDPGAVLAPEVLARHALIPLVNSHPPEDVTPATAQKLVVGAVGQDVRRDGNRARATLVIYDAAAIADVRAGKRELSTGYRCKLDPTPGVAPDGKRYDVRQYDWQPNHLAIEERGRAGDAVMRVDHAIDLDCFAEGHDLGECVDIDCRTNQATAPASAQKETQMAGTDKLAEAQAALAEQTKRADAAEAALAEQTKRTSAAEAALIAERAKRLDGAHVERVRAEVKARLELEQRVTALCPDAFPAERKDAAGKVVGRFDGLTDRELRLAVIKRVDGEDVPAELSDAIVEGYYASACSRADRGLAQRTALASRHVPTTSTTTNTTTNSTKNVDQIRAELAKAGGTIYGAKGA